MRSSSKECDINMANGFDIVAPIYDVTFTHTQIGKLQRNSVYKYLSESILRHKKNNILELNCGTGEDALWLMTQGHNVLATDLSEAMIAQAKRKTSEEEKIIFRQLDIRNLQNASLGKKFDLLFSNFGGLNCLSPDELKQFIQAAFKLLQPKGQLVMVIMPKRTLWERFYFIIKGKRKKAFRRNTNNSVAVELAGKTINMWYYNPSKIKEFAQDKFMVKVTKPIGFFVPPSYLEAFFKNKGKLLTFLGWLDRRISIFTWLSPYSDHYLISLKKQ